MVAYFEVSILENPATAATQNNNSVKRDCVAVGVATESFSCQTRMPGWDAQSLVIMETMVEPFMLRGPCWNDLVPALGPAILLDVALIMWLVAFSLLSMENFWGMDGNKLIRNFSNMTCTEWWALIPMIQLLSIMEVHHFNSMSADSFPNMIN